MDTNPTEYTPEAAAYHACREAAGFLLELIAADLEAGDAAVSRQGQRPDWGDADTMLKVRTHLMRAACEIGGRSVEDIESMIETGD